MKKLCLLIIVISLIYGYFLWNNYHQNYSNIIIAKEKHHGKLTDGFEIDCYDDEGYMLSDRPYAIIYDRGQ